MKSYTAYTMTQKDLPANSRTRHRRDNPRSSTTQEPAPAELPLDDRRGVDQSLGRPDLLVCRQASGLQERLDHVQRCGDTGRKGTGQTTGDAVGERIVVLPGVHDLGERFVCDELCGGEGNGHAEGGGIRDVKGLESFRAVDRPGTLPDALVDGAVNLHALLDHCIPHVLENRSREIGGSRSQFGSVSWSHSPSNGFINASLAMVAEEPLTAYTCQQTIYPSISRNTNHSPAASG